MKTAIVITGAVVAAIGPVLVALASILFIGGTIATTLGAAFTAIGSAVGFLLTPVGAVVASLVALGAAVTVVTLAIADFSFDEIFTAGKNTFDKITKTVKGFIANFETNMKILFSWFKEQWEIISGNVKAVWQSIGAVATAMTGVTKKNVREMFNTFLSFAEGTIGFIANIKENFKILSEFLLTTYTAVFRDLGNLTLTFLGNLQHNTLQTLLTLQTVLVETFSQVGQVLLEALKGNIKPEDIAKELKTRLDKAFSNEFKKFRTPLEGFESTLGNLPKFNLAVDGLNLPQFMFDQGKEAGEAAKKGMGVSAGNVLDIFGNTIDQAIGMLSQSKPEVQVKLSPIQAVEVGGLEAATRIREFRLNQSGGIEAHPEVPLLTDIKNVLGELVLIEKDKVGVELNPANIDEA